MGGEQNLNPGGSPPPNSLPPSYQQGDVNNSYQQQPQGGDSHYVQPPQYPAPVYPPVQQGYYGAPPPGPYQEQAYGQPGYGSPNPHGAVIITDAPHPQGDLFAPPPIYHHEDFSTQVKKLPERFWAAVTKPNLDNYNHLKLHASWEIVALILTFEVLWSVILVSIDYAAADVGGVGYAILFTFLFTPIFFFLSNLMFHGVALCLGGGAHSRNNKRMFMELCYLLLLPVIPLAIANLLTLIPIVGFIISVALLIYRLVLLVLSLQATYDVTVGHAIGILVVFIILVIVLFIILVFAFSISATFSALVLRAL